MPLAEFRWFIEIFAIASEANAIRKHHKRRPTKFADIERMLPRTRIWEHRLPARFTKPV